MLIALLIVPWVFLAGFVGVPPRYGQYGVIAMALAELGITVAGLKPGQWWSISWWPTLGLNFAVGVTSINLPLLWMNALVFLATVLAMKRPSRDTVIWLTLAFWGVTVAFLSRNWLLYFLGFETAVLPFFLLVRKHGGAGRRTAAFYFLAFSGVAGMLLLSAVLYLARHHITVVGGGTLPLFQQQLVFRILLLAWAIKTPLWPFHAWLPRMHGEASTPVSMYLAGSALKVAPYGFLLFSGLLRGALQQADPFWTFWGAITLLVGSGLAFAQKDVKQTVALSSIASMGYVMMALASGTALGTEAAILVMVGHGLASPFLFWIVGRIQEVTGGRQLSDLTGLYRRDPATVRWLTLAALAYMGAPGLALFPGELGVLVSVYQRTPLALALVVPALVLMSATWVRILARARFGSGEPVATASGLGRGMGWVLGLPLLGLGLDPGWWIHVWQWGGFS